ncbi:MAG: ATP-dependent DNA helicase PcrA [Lachnospiraceae bacterium]|uniref:ATP-dependent DNA helicase PcrA n=1 Tax=Candidatus Weimeria bifida TaxID=2599074 RepID=A0A6N7IZQ7_9FIRM|nr:AAA family ATPase [Candidatus Weimeria bifida]RRF96506.1 MAG: ATP-dependent DNA helicase PcrA [Lachnospiraceae bacterium]
MENLEKLLNKEQLEGVLTTEGPVLILAGAGSGKTRVLTHRVAYLIAEKNVNPWNIMAITFTNKAAAEMRERVDRIAGEGSEGVWISTFHSACVRILRRFADRIGYKNSFSIYDSDDSKSLMKQIIKLKNLDPKKYKEKRFLGQISDFKNNLIDCDEAEKYLKGAEGRLTAGIYREYQARLKSNNAMDFDDLIMNAVLLLKSDKEVKAYYNDRLHYIMVDEYQDTNAAQFELIKLLSEKRKNLCVVGDDDQSIYKFRGADITNILSFEEHFPGAKVIKLEQNYRSYTSILNAANAVIKNNRGRKDKSLWSNRGEGEKVRFRQFESSYEEADFIADDIRKREKSLTADYKDFAVLYRTNAQSRTLEEKLMMAGIPYRIVGGINFYQRREIKDILAYLTAIENPDNDVAIRRILNVPKRGIGATTEGKIAEYAAGRSLSFYDGMQLGVENGMFGRSGKKLSDFMSFIDTLRTKLSFHGVVGLVKDIIEDTGYSEELKLEDTDESRARLENLDELINKAALFEHEINEDEETKDLPADEKLSLFLQDVSLMTSADTGDDAENHVTLMTLHAAKGLEFPHVYITGLEDGLFPSQLSINSDDSDEEIEEERRLMYVGITRAMDTLTLTCAKARMVRGQTEYMPVSRFVKEIPAELLDGRVEKTSYSFDERADYKERADFGFKAYVPKENDYGSLAYGGIYGYSGNAKGQKRKPRKKKEDISLLYTKGADMVKSSLDYGVGDRVKHTKFGEGTVTEIKDGGRDYQVTVEFDTAGRKKMFAGFARLEKI